MFYTILFQYVCKIFELLLCRTTLFINIGFFFSTIPYKNINCNIHKYRTIDLTRKILASVIFHYCRPFTASALKLWTTHPRLLVVWLPLTGFRATAVGSFGPVFKPRFLYARSTGEAWCTMNIRRVGGCTRCGRNNIARVQIEYLAGNSVNHTLKTLCLHLKK